PALGFALSDIHGSQRVRQSENRARSPCERVSERYHLALYFRGLRFEINKLHKNAISYNFRTMPNLI
ncbi:MAG: hypothetical protein NWE90_08925, partial [Candidatus Bathyarchaeota archaeon]|nr:hypothetical protein [Candidatus Bathyarchaeota archaeon]